MALPIRTVILGSPASPTHKIDPIELADSLEAIETEAPEAEAGAIAAQEAAEVAQEAAEAARDVAFVNADVYADTAAGLAATTVGDQFQVVDGDEIVRYRHDAGPVATEVARYPSASAVGSTVSGAMLYEEVDQDRRQAYAIDVDGHVIVPFLDSLEIEVDDLNAARSTTKAKEIGGEVGRGYVGDQQAYSDHLTANGALMDQTDADLRSALRVDRDGQLWFDGQTGQVRARGRAVAVSDTHLVVSQRRPNSANYDLYSERISDGHRIRLTTDASDIADFANPAISGDVCIFDKFIDEMVETLTVPLTGGTAIPLLPSRSFLLTGDSFVQLITQAGFYAAFEALVRPMNVTAISEGGANMERILELLETVPQFHDRILVIMDGSGDALANNQTYLPQIIATLASHHKRWVYVQPCITGDAETGVTQYYYGEPARANWEAAWGWVQSTYPGNFVPTFDALLAANDGSAGDLEDVSNGITPRSLRQPLDGLHLNAAGYAVTAEQTRAFIESKGWLL